LDILVHSIDFDKRTVQLHVRRGITPERRDNLRRFIQLCHKHGFNTVDILCAPSLPKRTVALLDDLKKDYPGIILRKSTRNKRTKRGVIEDVCIYRGESSNDDNIRTVEYVIRLADFKSALDRVNKVVLIVGSSISLDERCLSHLEFCLHELVANTIEHAAFTTSAPEIQVRLVTRPDSVHIAYRDNAEPFRPSQTLEVDISNRIKEGKKRGFGIFLLHQITEAFKHERDKDWNKTTFYLKRNLQPQEA
jgi:anti-sigma regulatory factor (Ser/Thr protein kinase)